MQYNTRPRLRRWSPLATVALLPCLAVGLTERPAAAQVPITIRPPAPPMPPPMPLPPPPPVTFNVQPPGYGYAQPPNQGGTQVQLQTDDLRAGLFQLQGGGIVYGLGFRYGRFRHYQSWGSICRAPCGVAVNPNEVFSIRGPGIVPSDAFSLPQTGVVGLSVRAGHSGVRSGGVIMTTFGSIHTVVGIVFTAIGAGLSSDPGRSGTSSGMLIAGVTNLAVGTALMAGGIAMIVASRTRVTTSDGYTLALGPKSGKDSRPKLALASDGLHF